MSLGSKEIKSESVIYKLPRIKDYTESEAPLWESPHPSLHTLSCTYVSFMFLLGKKIILWVRYDTSWIGWGKRRLCAILCAWHFPLSFGICKTQVNSRATILQMRKLRFQLMKTKNEFYSEILLLKNGRDCGVIKGIRKSGGASLGFLF